MFRSKNSAKLRNFDAVIKNIDVGRNEFYKHMEGHNPVEKISKKSLRKSLFLVLFQAT